MGSGFLTMALLTCPHCSFGVISLFPEMFSALKYGITGRAQKEALIKIHYWNPRAYTKDKHGQVDDSPYGGGPGMVMKEQPIKDAIIDAKKTMAKASVIYLSPQGRRIDQQQIEAWSQQQQIVLLAGRYEGIDERLMTTLVIEEWSLGDYILSGGELAAMVLIDAVTRLLPGALGNTDSAKYESFSDSLLDYPHYTRPEVENNLAVPSVLLSGNHEAIRCWRLKQSLGRTWLRRPDLLKQKKLTSTELLLLDEFKHEYFLGVNHG